MEQRLSAGSIGFNAEVANKNDLNIDELLKKVEPKDLTKFGLIPEFIGRVPVMVSLEQLTKDAMVRILSEPKNALMRQYQKLFELDNVKLEFTQEALEEIAQLAVDRKIGARGLRSILESVMMDLMYEIPSDDSIGICTITRDVVKKAGQPELVYRDMPPASARCQNGSEGTVRQEKLRRLSCSCDNLEERKGRCKSDMTRTRRPVFRPVRHLHCSGFSNG